LKNRDKFLAFSDRADSVARMIQSGFLSEEDRKALTASSSGQGRLPESLHFAESDVILGVVRGEKCPQSLLWA
jgi:hypothetical protein